MTDIRAGEWATPRHFIRIVEEAFGPLLLDAAATARNSVVRVRKGARGRSWINKRENGLKVSWKQCVSELWGRDPATIRAGAVWCNPPYKRIEPWVEKAIAEAGGGLRVLLLLPRRSTKWYFHLHSIGAEIWELQSRLKFGGAATSGFTDNILIHLHPPHPNLIRFGMIKGMIDHKGK